MEGRALLLAPEAEGPAFVFRLGGNGAWSCTDSWSYKVQKGSEGHWWLLDETGEEIGAPEAPPGGGDYARAAAPVPAKEEPVADDSALQGGKVKEVAGDRRAIYSLILAAAKERNARAAAAAVTDDPLDGDSPPRGRWTVRNSIYRLSLLEMSPAEDDLLALQCQYEAALRPLGDMLGHLESVVGPLGGLVCDLGCGAGAAARLLASRGGVAAIGIDSDPRMVAAAKARSPNLPFRCADVGKLHVFKDLQGAASGVWCSFVSAYFPGKQLEKALLQWAWLLQPGGWLCLLDLDGLFSVHRPFEEGRWARDFRQLDDDLQNVMKYDPFVGKRLAQTCKKAKLQVLSEREWPGATEFNFDGPASEDQVNSWAVRMETDAVGSVFRKYFRDFDKTAKEAFLECLRSEEHATRCKVRMVICTKPSS